MICREKLDTVEDVMGFISGKQAEIKVLGAARQKCYNRLRRCEDGTEIAQIKAQRDRLKENLKLEQKMQAQRMGRTQDKHRGRSVARWTR